MTKLVAALQAAARRSSVDCVTLERVARDIARTILDGFDKHYRLFRETSARAKYRFERGALGRGARGVEARASRCTTSASSRRSTSLRERFPDVVRDESLWPEIKLAYIGLLHEHRQPECAETFYNSVACRVLDRRYYRNEYIFRRPAISTEHLDGEEPTYRCYYPTQARPAHDDPRRRSRASGWRARSRTSTATCAASSARCASASRARWRVHDNFQIQVLSSLFFRNKARVRRRARPSTATDEYPFVVPLLQRRRRRGLRRRAAAQAGEHRPRLQPRARRTSWSTWRCRRPTSRSSQTLLPSKPKAELYTMLGLQKQGKTLFFRDLIEHMKHSTDRSCSPPGTRGHGDGRSSRCRRSRTSSR